MKNPKYSELIQITTKMVTVSVRKVPKCFDRKIIEKWTCKLVKLYGLERDVFIDIRGIKEKDGNLKPNEKLDDNEIYFGLCNIGDFNWHEVIVNSLLLKRKRYQEFLETLCHEFFHCIGHETFFTQQEQIPQDKNWSKNVDKLVDSDTTPEKKKLCEEKAHVVGKYLGIALFDEFKKDIEESEYMGKPKVS